MADSDDSAKQPTSGAETTSEPPFADVDSSEQRRGLGRAEPPPTQAEMATVWHVTFDDTPGGSLKPTAPKEEWAPEPSTYSLQRLIAKGGFGEVWEATQLTLRRRIAVKRIRADLCESGEEDASFRAHEIAFRQEAMTTAALEHPNIPPVHDLGLDEDGRPLLAMKLVRGKPWDALITHDFVSLGIQEFLARHITILIDVAQAVAFAHSRGIVHRDIKPAQVMVGEFGEVVLMDWGLAVVWNHDRLEREIPGAPRNLAPSLRRATNPAGTPAFMAPEQTERTAERIGPWTDVFLLGGTLYYLLTGYFPHPGRTSEQLIFQAALCEIRKPEERARDREIPAELSALAMHSLQREPKLRVESAAEFLRRLQDYLTGATRRRESVAITDAVARKLEEAVEGYKEWGDLLVMLGNARTLWPENPAQFELRAKVFAVSAQTALSHGDLILARVQAERIPDSPVRVDLLRRIGEAEEEKRRQARALDEASQRLREHHARAEDLLNYMMNDLTDKLRTIGRVEVLDTVVERALAYFNALPAGEMSNDMLVRRSIGLRQVGEVRMDQGDTAGAETAIREALSIVEGIASLYPENRDWQFEFAECRAAMGRILRAKGQLEEAGRTFLAQEALLEPLLRARPADPRIKEAVAKCNDSLADVLAVGGRLDEALDRNRRYRELSSELVARDPASYPWQRALAEAHGNYGWILRAKGRLDESLDQYRIALEITARIYAANPSNMQAFGNLAFMHNKLGWVLESKGELAAAIEEFLRSLDIMQQLVRRDPSNMRWRRLLAVTHCRAARAMEAKGDLADARREYDAAIATIEPMERADREDVWNREWFSRALVGLGRVEERAGRPENARALWSRAVEATRVNVRNYESAELRHLSTFAQALLHLGRLNEARPIVSHLQRKDFRDEDFETAIRLMREE